MSTAVMEEIRIQLVAINENLKHIYRTTDETSAKVEDIHDKVIVNTEAIKGLDKRVAANESVAEDYKSNKSKIVGLALGAGAGSGGILAWLAQVFER